MNGLTTRYYTYQGNHTGPDAFDQTKDLTTRGTPRQKPAKQPGPLSPCGTTRAYRRHKYHKQDPCAPCKAAWREHDRNRKARKRADKIRMKEAA